LHVGGKSWGVEKDRKSVRKNGKWKRGRGGSQSSEAPQISVEECSPAPSLFVPLSPPSGLKKATQTHEIALPTWM